MKEKTVKFEDGTEVVLGSASAGRYYDIMNSDAKLAEKSKQMIVASIKGWNIKDNDGKDVTVTAANFDKHITVDYLRELNDACEEINNLSDVEKKTS